MTNLPHPSIENAPGLRWRKRKTGWEARWQARSDLVARGYEVPSVHLWFGTEPTAFEIAAMQERCNGLQVEMLMWGRDGEPLQATFTGTVASLIECYQTDPDSNYRRTLRTCTKQHYDAMCRRLTTDIGDVRVADLDARSILRWHEDLTVNGAIPLGHACIGMLRTLMTFGATLLKSKACREAKMLLHDMKFPMGKPRGERLTADQANLIRAKAHEVGRHSIALAQAFQFEGMLRQKDVIGEIVPMSERGTSYVLIGDKKWMRGLLWEEIDENMILRHITSKKQKLIEIDLSLAPMVMEELRRFQTLPKRGPIIICETTNRPWSADEYRRQWRKIATDCGIPKTVFNMDSRAGGISEATDAGAPLEHVRHAATHSNTQTTMGYSRNSAEKTAEVMRLRVASRNKNDK
jgi:hypothetical protein